MAIGVWISLFAYFALMIASDMDSDTGWNTVWLVVVACVGMMGPYGVARLYDNPFDVTTESHGQSPYISDNAITTEHAIVAIFRGYGACRAR